MADETLRKLMFIALNLPKDGIGHTLMRELIEDYCLGCGVSRLSPQEKEKDAQNDSDSDSDSDTEMDPLAGFLYCSKQKLTFGKFDLYREAAEYILDKRHTLNCQMK